MLRGDCSGVVGRGVSRWLAVALPLFALALGVPAKAAELRVSYAELAGLVQKAIGNATIHLHNKPVSISSLLTTTSYVAIGGQQIEVPLAPKSFDVLGSTYAYYVDDVNSSAIRVTPVAGALRLTLQFESKGAELSGGCVKGNCGLVDALPVINWDDSSVTIDLVPTRANGSLALQAKAVQIGGTLKPSCTGAGGFFSDLSCDAALPFASRAIAKLKPELSATLKDKINDPALQASVAGQIQQRLTIGGFGTVAITDVASDSKGVTVTFKIVGGG